MSLKESQNPQPLSQEELALLKQAMDRKLVESEGKNGQQVVVNDTHLDRPVIYKIDDTDNRLHVFDPHTHVEIEVK